MELLNFCNTSDFKKILVDNGYSLKQFKTLSLIKYDYNKNMKDNYQKYLKSTIFLDNKPVCVSPLKSLKLNDESVIETIKINLSEIEIQELLDGTMINLFYDKEDWIISTRSSIGGLNRWNNKKIKDLFMECCNFQNLKENLNKEYSYSFVLQHKDIRNISFIKENKLILVDVFDLKTLQNIKNIDDKFNEIPVDKIKNITTNLESIKDVINKYIEDNKNNYNFKGLTFKIYNNENPCRYSYINPIYLKVKNEIVVNDTNPLYIYSDLWKNNKLNDYLKVYPDKKELFLKYDNNLKILLNELLQTYHSLHIHKCIERKDVKYQLNPLLYNLHRLHINDNVYINYNAIKNYIKTIDTARLVFTLKYYN
jgi:hypothetical protein